MQATGQLIPTGGVCVIQIKDVAGPPLVFSRAIGSGGFEVIETQPEPGSWTVFIDPGLGLPSPLPSDQGAISYQLQDSATTLVLSGLTPTISLDATPDWVDEIVYRAYLAGVSNLQTPPNWQAATFLMEMPKIGFPKLPFIFWTPVTLEQSQTQIGQDVPTTLTTPGRQLSNVSVQARRTWHLGILSRTATERDFYRDACLGIFQSLLGSLFLPLGLDMQHSFRAQSSQDASRDTSPGLYRCDLLLTVEGMFNTALVPTYGIIQSISGSITGVAGGLIESTGFLVTASG